MFVYQQIIRIQSCNVLHLESAGCERIYEEYAAAETANRPKLKELITVMKSGDELIVWKLDRIEKCAACAIDVFKICTKKVLIFEYYRWRRPENSAVAIISV